MTSEDSQEPPLVSLGRYSPHEASKLLERLERSGITFRAEPQAPRFAINGPTIAIDISALEMPLR